MKLKKSCISSKKARLVNFVLLSVVPALGVIGFSGVVLTPVLGQIIAPFSQSEDSAEVEKLNQQIIQLYNQLKYKEAIPLAKQVLFILKQKLGEKHPGIVTSLYNLAFLYQLQGRYSEAEPYYKEALAILNQQPDKKHPNIAITLTSLALLYQLQGRYSEAEPLYTEVEAILKKQPGNNHPVIPQYLNNLAGLYQLQGRYSEAEPLYKKASSILKQKLGDKHPYFAFTLNNLGLLYYLQGRYSEAEPLYKEALAIRKEVLGDHPDTATSLNNLALLYQLQGKYSEAEPLYKEALAIRKEVLGDHPDTATSLISLGLLYQLQGKYNEAEPFYTKALAMLKQRLDSNHPDIATSLNNWAGLYYLQGRYSEAEPLYKEALAIRKQKLDDKHPDIATSLNNLAGLYQLQGKYREAEQSYTEALTILRKRFGNKHIYVAFTLNNLALLYYLQGRYSEAEPLYKEALDIRKQKLDDKHPDIATNLNNLGLLYQLQGRFSEAESLYTEALTILRQKLGNDHPYVGFAVNNLALLYLSQGNTTRTIKYFTQGLEVEEYNISQNLVPGDEKQKQDYMRTTSGTTYQVISLNLQSAPDNPEATRLALKTILQRKGRILDVLTNSLQVLRQQINDPESKELLDQFIQKQTQLANLTFQKTETIKSVEGYRQELLKLEVETKELGDKLSRLSAEFRNLSQPTTLETIQKLIPANAALVEIVRYQPFNPKATLKERFGTPRYAVYILYPDGEIKAKDLGEAKLIEDDLIAFRDNLRDKDTPLIQLKESARKLDAKLMQPVRQLLGNTKTILLSPDAALNLIPFEALVDENDRYLVENYHINYLTSGRDLLRLKDKFPSQQSPIIIADPLYGKEGEKVSLTRTRSIDLSKFTFSRLEGTKEEANALKQLLPQAIVLTESQATENALKQVQKPNILHIATHGFFLESSKTDKNNESPENFDNPLLRSGLVLAGVKLGQSAGDDGVVTALETTTLNLVGTKLVVLSACDTGVGDITTGEGVYGLRRALVIAGSESQLISLWKVSDNAIKDLMLAYYGRLKKGEGRSEALRQIQLEMIKSENHKHPFFWASLILSGESKPMKFD